MAAWLAAHGHDVTIVCAKHPNAPRDEVRDGVTFRRRGGRLTVYPRALMYLLSRTGRRADIVIDVQNGLPFFSPLVRRGSIVVLVHHVHREQWQLIYPGPRGRFGWWLESRLAPMMYRRRKYVTVSNASAADLTRIGVSSARIQVIQNGIDVPHPSARGPRAAAPTVCVLGRLVPHKQVEHALDAMALLRTEVPGLRLDIVGDGWWRENLERHALSIGVDDIVTFRGYLDEPARDRVLDAAWLLLAPSVKEGWGIAIMEAAAHGVPAIAYTTGGGVRESILDGQTGALVDDFDELVVVTKQLLSDHELRLRMASAARQRAGEFEWASSGAKLQDLLEQQIELDQRLP